MSASLATPKDEIAYFPDGSVAHVTKFTNVNNRSVESTTYRKDGEKYLMSHSDECHGVIFGGEMVRYDFLPEDVKAILDAGTTEDVSKLKINGYRHVETKNL